MYRGRDTLAAPIRPSQMTEQELPWHPPRTLFQAHLNQFQDKLGTKLKKRP
jgi:hypothetical protein